MIPFDIRTPIIYIMTGNVTNNYPVLPHSIKPICPNSMVSFISKGFTVTLSSLFSSFSEVVSLTRLVY